MGKIPEIPQKSSKQLSLSFVLKKDILEEIKDYAAGKNYRKDGVLSLFKKVHTKFTHWELANEKNRDVLCKAMNALYCPSFLQYLTAPSEIEKLLEMLEQKDDFPLEM